MKERFKRLYFEHFDSLLRFASFYAQDQDEASSAVQQTFLSVWEKRKDLLEDTNRDLKSYLYTSVRNKVFTYQRRQKFESSLEDSLDKAESNSSPHEKLENQELEARIKQTIQNLPERCQYIFRLSREEGMTYKEIANQLDLSIKTVENQISKALLILRNEIYGTDIQ